MKEEKITVKTADGDCPVYVFAPDDGSRHPAAIMYTDAFGIRPASLAMGRRLASHGYVVLVPDIFYRAGSYGPIDPHEIYSTPNGFDSVRPLMASTDTRRATADSGRLLDYLDTRDDTSGTGVGVTGYCMGGTLAFTAGGSYPDRIAAVATFHTARLITDDELSPSLVATAMKARVLVAGADHDPGYPPEMAQELDRLLGEAGVERTLEVYPEARHGFTQTDSPVYDEQAAERHWSELVGLFDSTLV
ncbi:MAG TPA: dienelactone hydrolase family protein [Microbacteriaceae bacterium]|nr:dienelactone hydrolase family protein [Microbacteriaceae bacterium]